MKINKYSRHITQDDSQPAAKAMLHAIGLSTEDLLKAQVGIASLGWEGNPCNMHLNDIAKHIKTAVQNEELVALIYHCMGVSDGISMGTAGMNYSLPSRDVIADSIETVACAQWYDAIISVVGCDKNMPGAMMALGRLNRPAILFYGGTIAPGCHKDKDISIISTFEALGDHLAGGINKKELNEVIQKACPGAGACGGMYTANTMASAIEAMGMSLPFNASNPALSTDKNAETQNIGQAIKNLMIHDIKPRDIVTKNSLINALRLITVLGGSTNAVMHMIAIAKAFGLSLSLKEIQQVSDETPFLANLKPSGQYMMQDLHNVGGIPAVMKLMYKEGLLFSTAMTVTGMTVAENLENVQDLTESQKVIYPISQPIKSSGHLQMLFGNLAKEGSVAKITGKEGLLFEGKAKVYDSEAAANEAIQNNQIEKGNVIVIRYCGPKGGPGMPEMLKPTGLIMGSGLGKHVALITDGRFSGGSHGFVVGHITPEAYNGGIIALLEDGDTIKIDAESNTIDVALSDEEILRRRNNRVKPNDKPIGVLAKYRQNGITKSLQHLKFQKYLLKHSTSRTQEGLGLS